MKILLLVALWASAGLCQENTYVARPGLIRVGGLIIFYDSQGPLSFVTMTQKDLPQGAVLLGPVKGRGCQHGLSIPITASFRGTTLSGAKGDGGYKKAVEDIHRLHPELAGIYDVQVDLHTLSILVYRRVCTEVAARGFRF